jgi:hypothetical protein
VGKPLWRRAYDTVERPLATRLEAGVQTEQFADVAALLVWSRAEVRRRTERITRHALHRVNLPAASDVALLRQQVSSLERSVRRLEEAVRQEAVRASAPGEQTRGRAVDGADDRSGSRSGGTGATRRRAQPVKGAQRRQVRDRDRPAEGRDDAQVDRVAP